MRVSMMNSIGMKLVRLEPGRFMMGQAEGGDWDEQPVHRVDITRPYYMSVTEVTNAQYERFDPGHRRYRGYNGFSIRDDEAVVFVSWYDAMEFCRWLSEKEGKPYRLPTEAEWEYAARAGTTTPFCNSKELPACYHRHQKQEWNHVPVSLTTGLTPPNPCGLYDMHGNVEEWCYDWYGPYEAGEQVDPVGRASGEFRVARGGSHNTEPKFLRSANRMAALPEERHWLIGFRVVQAELPSTPPLPPPEPPLCMREVDPGGYSWEHVSNTEKPFFYGPVPYVKQPLPGTGVPMYGHNHCPSITWCPNGDLLAVWFSCEKEAGREMVILGSRLRAGKSDWDPASLFFDVPDRNMTGSSLFQDSTGKLIFINGVEVAGSWGHLAMVMRTSSDSGATWSRPRLINPYHHFRNQPIHGMIETREGYLIQACDAVPWGEGGTALYMSRDRGETWEEVTNYGYGCLAEKNSTGGWIAGIHAGIVQLEDGSLMALGRGNDINGHMPMSISRDMGKTWTYFASEFPPIGGGQRLVLMRLREGPILFVGFTDSSKNLDSPRGIVIRDSEGGERRVYGMFAALSYDEGKTWPVQKLVTPGGSPIEMDGGAWTKKFVIDATHAEPRGYLAATQTPDGMIHLVSSRLYYCLNLAWLEQGVLREQGC